MARHSPPAERSYPHHRAESARRRLHRSRRHEESENLQVSGGGGGGGVSILSNGHISPYPTACTTCGWQVVQWFGDELRCDRCDELLAERSALPITLAANSRLTVVGSVVVADCAVED